MIYAYQSHKFINSILVHVVKPSGEIIGVFEFFNSKKAKELLEKWFGLDYEWVDRPWEDRNVKDAQENYTAQYGITMTERSYGRNN